jgi:hypothetical protein
MRVLVGIAAAALALGSGSAYAQGPVEPFDGTIPFECVLQQAGTEAEFPDPDADPFCVEYDKRHQNVTELGVVQFLSLEPARVAAASPKCFYYQRDHWVGSVVQEDGRTETYSWDGSYYFDKAKGAGGAYVENFTFNNQSGDPTAMPGFPEEWKPHFGYGRGGIHSPGGVDADPSCIAKAEEKSPYRKEPEPKPSPRGCPEPEGAVGSSIGGLRLRATRRATLDRNGEPKYVRRGFLRYCVQGGGKFMAGFPSSRAGARAEFLLTSNPGFEVSGVRRLTPERQAKRRLTGERELFRTSKTRVWAVRKRDHMLLVLIRKRRVAALASAAKALSKRAVISYYRRSR